MASRCCVRRVGPRVADGLEGDEATGARLVATSLIGPIKQIAENAGVKGGVVIAKVLSMSGNEGYNAATDNYEDLVKIGVIDAAKVTRSALQNAASIAALFLTTEVVIVDKPEPAPAMPAAVTWTSDPPLGLNRPGPASPQRGPGRRFQAGGPVPPSRAGRSDPADACGVTLRSDP